ncbi:MAG TPA: hypothetical protein ENJ04_03680 [Nitrospirae bacterium]|nr:hypothetical protein [Nitrospirota bacterium]
MHPEEGHDEDTIEHGAHGVTHAGVPILGRAGLPVTVAGASEDVRRFSAFVTANMGGRGIEAMH